MQSPLNCVFYGPSGSGKTTIAASFPKPLLHIDINEKTQEVLTDFDNVQTIHMLNAKDVDDIYWWLKDQPERFRSIVFDSVGQFQDMIIDEFTQGGKKSMTQRDWGFVGGRMKSMITNLVKLPQNVVIIAHDRTFVLEAGDADDTDLPGEVITTPEVGPAVMPSVAKVLNASVGILGNTFIMEESVNVEKKVGKKVRVHKERIVKYCMRLGPHAVYRSKVRKPLSVQVPSYIENPNYEKLVQVMKGEYSGS